MARTALTVTTIPSPYAGAGVAVMVMAVFFVPLVVVLLKAMSQGRL